MKIQIPREKIFLIIAAFLIGLYVLINGAAFIRGKEEDLDRQLAKAEVAFKKQYNLISTGAKSSPLTKQTGTDAQELANINSAVVTVAQELGLTLEKAEDQAVKSEKLFKEFSVAFDLESSWEQLNHFLYLIETQPYSFKIRDIQIRKNPELSHQLNCHLTLSQIFSQ